jgi:hypothetical protein
MIYTILMRRNPADSSSSEILFLQHISKLWPAIKGSMAQVRKTCLRPGCKACAQGEKHRAFILSFTQDGKRRCMYVPKDLVPLLERALQNGRRIEALLYELGPKLLQDHRQRRGSRPES